MGKVNLHNEKKIIRIKLGFCVLGVGVSIAMFLTPLLSDILSQLCSDEVVSKMSSSYKDKQNPKRLFLLEQAQKYNKALMGNTTSDFLPLEEQLVSDETSAIAYLEIKKISVKLPVYHGTEQNVLMSGIGHLNSSSLPVGGESSHCVLTAHSGMASMRAFDDLHKLDIGDKFVVWTLLDPYCYEVYEKEVVLPNEVSSLTIQQDKDLCTLVTCTPYAVNTHRLLVHAKRCEYTDELSTNDNFMNYVNSRTIPLFVGIAIVALFFITLASVNKYKKYRRAEGVKNDNVNKN